MKSMGGHPEPAQDQIHKTVGVRGLLEQNHKDQAHGQGVGHIGQKIHRLIQIPQLPDRTEAHGNQKRQPGGHRHRDHHQNEGILQRLEKIGVVEDIGIVVDAHALIGLGRKVIGFLKGIDKHVNKGINHKDPEKDHGRQQIHPALEISFFHGSLLRPDRTGSVPRLPGRR